MAALAAAFWLGGCSSPPTPPPATPPPNVPVPSAGRPPGRAVPLPQPPAPERSSNYPPLPAPAIQRIGGVDYTDARAFFARYGLKATVQQSGHRLRLQDALNLIELDADQRDALVNGLVVFLGEPVVARGTALFISRVDAEKLFAPLVQPGRYASLAPTVRTIVLDAGHGAQDSGALNTPLRLEEKTFALDVVLRLKPLLEARGCRVVLTRANDTFIPLPQRAVIANEAHADLFISVHFNSAPPSVHGTETYFMTPQGQASTQAEKDKEMIPTLYPGNRLDPLNALLGYAIHRQVTAQLGSMDRGLKHARYEVLRLVSCPAVLVESGYISSDTEGRKIATPAYRQQIAEGIASGVTAYLAQLAGAKRP